MATLALMAVGAMIGSASGGVAFGIAAATIGATIGSMVGGVVDSMYTFPLIFGKGGDPNGNRIGDISIQSGSEGSPMPIVFGPQNRFSGVVIWIDDWLREKKESKVGKDFGGTGYQIAFGWSTSLLPENRQTSYTYYTSLAICLGDTTVTGPLQSVDKIWADGRLIYQATGNVKRPVCEEITIYLGGDDQDPDPTMESILGVGNVPAYNYTAYVVFKSLNLTTFGNRIPQFTFQVNAHTTKTVASTIQNLASLAGLDPNLVDVSAVTGTVRGYTIFGLQPPVQSIQNLMMLRGLSVQERDGKLFFFPRTTRQSITVEELDLGATDEGSDLAVSFPIEEVSLYDLPSGVLLNYFDPQVQYQNGVQPAYNHGSKNNAIANLSLPFVMTAKEARNLAHSLLWYPWIERSKVQFTLPYRYLVVQEGDALNVTYLGQVYRVRAQNVSLGANFLMMVNGTIEETAEATDFDAEDIPNVEEPIYTPPALTTAILDIAPMRYEEATQYGVYVIAAATDYTLPWEGAALYYSQDNVTYGLKLSLPLESDTGETTTPLVDGINPGLWDRGNAVVVEMMEGELTSATELEVLNGANRILIGNEIIAFTTATLVSARTYTLSHLLRGLRDTADCMTGHSVGDRVVVLAAGSLAVASLSALDLGAPRYLKLVASEGEVTPATPISLTFLGGFLRPFAPCHVRGVRDGSNNLSLAWLRRSRVPYRMFSSGAPNTLSEAEVYSVDVMSGSTVLRTLNVTAPAASYTAAQQTADGLTPGNPVTVRVYQVSSIVGRSKKEEVTV